MRDAIRHAVRADAEPLAALINEAYAVEASMIAGKRTSVAAIDAMLADESGRFFVVAGADGALSACVYTQDQPDPDGASVDPVAYLGLLSVRPDLQQRGLGKRLVAHVTESARSSGRRAITITVVSVRDELFPYYEALGFVRTDTQPYRDPTAVLVPGLHLVRMRRAL